MSWLLMMMMMMAIVVVVALVVVVASARLFLRKRSQTRGAATGFAEFVFLAVLLDTSMGVGACISRAWAHVASVVAS